MNELPPTEAAKRRYLWPWILAAAVLMAIVIAVLSVRKEADRIKLQRSLELPNSGE